MKYRRAHAVIASAAYFMILLAVGCTGRGRIDFVSLNMNEIDPPQAVPWTFQADESYWWVSDEGELNIAMRHRTRNLFLGKMANVDLAMSFVFEAPPAGRARNYRISPRDVRTVYASPLAPQRFNATSGIAGVTIGKDDALRGSFRIWTMPMVETSLFSFLPQRPGSVLCYGTFEAVRDARRGQSIRDASEANGYVRPKKGATSQPAARTMKVSAISADPVEPVCGRSGG